MADELVIPWPPHTDKNGWVFIPHPEGEGEPRCHAGCNYFSDGRRHMPDCPTTLAWKKALGITEREPSPPEATNG